jgi:predicted dehydrogenase
MENERILKIGVVGLIRGASVASRAFQHKSARVTAVCDIDAARVAEVQKQFAEQGHQAEGFTDFEEFLAKGDFEAVIVANYATEHVPLVVKCLEAGKHVLSEVPAINSVEEVEILRRAVAEHPEQKYMLAENCNYWAFVTAWKSMYKDGALGEAIYCEAEYLHALDHREHKPYENPNHWRIHNPAIKYCTHELGPLLDILDDRCVSVSCMEPEVIYNPYRPRQKNGVAIFRTEKGAVIRLLIVFDAYVGYDHNYSIIGTRGSIQTDKNISVGAEAHSFASLSSVPESRNKKIEIPISTHFSNESSAGHGGADVKTVLSFIDCVLNDTEPPIGIDLAIRMTLPGIIAAESAAQGGALLEIPNI